MNWAHICWPLVMWNNIYSHILVCVCVCVCIHTNTQSLVHVACTIIHCAESLMWQRAAQWLLHCQFAVVWVHMFECNVLQLILGFYSPYLMKELAVVSFSSQACITHHIAVCDHMLFLWKVLAVVPTCLCWSLCVYVVAQYRNLSRVYVSFYIPVYWGVCDYGNLSSPIDTPES